MEMMELTTNQKTNKTVAVEKNRVEYGANVTSYLRTCPELDLY
jgi:hypothetical protein